MKHAATAPNASMAMPHDPRLVEAVRDVIHHEGISFAIETGTYLGAGSTRIVADAMASSGDPWGFVTFEVKVDNWHTASANLRDRIFTRCMWGLSVPYLEAVDFLQSDEAIFHHDRYPDIYIDDLQNPLAFYMKEIQSENNIALLGRPSPPPLGLWSGDGLLAKFLCLWRHHRPFVVLDSAGGIGWLEFQTLVQEMGDHEFVLLLDDTKHLKHFRSLKTIKANPTEWDVLAEDDERGWVLAWHKVSVT